MRQLSIAILSVCSVAGTWAQSFEKEARIAVLVGVGRYPAASGFEELKYPARDVERLEIELLRQGYKVVALKDQDATKKAVIQALRNASDLTEHGKGTALFFFSGRGFSVMGSNLLATFDANAANLPSTGLALRTVDEMVSAAGAARRALFIDASRDGAPTPRTFDQILPMAGTRVLFSTKPKRVSYEDDALESGVFAHFLVRGLHGEAGGADGSVMFRGLADYVRDAASAHGFQQNRVQVPFDPGGAPADFQLGRKDGANGGPAAEAAVAKAKELYKARDYSGAAASFREAAQAGSAEAMARLGGMSASAAGTPRDYAEAMSWYRRAADLGYGPAMDSIGDMYERALGVAQDFAEALKWYRKAADAGAPDACNDAGQLYAFGRGVTRDYVEALKWYRRGAERGDNQATNNIGWLYENGYGVKQDDAEAMKWYRKAADMGNRISMDQVGYMYAQGRGVRQDFAEAFQWYKKASEAGNNDGMYDMARAYSRGEGVQRDYAEAMKWYRKAADAGHGASMNNIGTLYEDGLGVPQDYKEAERWYRKAADVGKTTAMHNLGELYLNGRGVAQDYAEAMKWHRKAADGGYATSMNQVGWMIQNGWGVKQDYGEAMRWYRKAADAGNSTGMNNIGWLYQNGWGVTQDYAEAMKWYRKAADAGNGLGLNNAGWLYQNGWGVTQDYAEAMKWYRKSAEAGNALGLNNVGWLYQNGWGVTQDYAEAMQWYRKASEAGNSDATNSVGSLYENGRGVSADRAEAVKWYRKAAASGNQAARGNLQRLGEVETASTAVAQSGGLFSVAPRYPGASLVSGGDCPALSANCNAILSAAASKKQVFDFYTGHLEQDGWTRDVAMHAPSEGGRLGNKALWGIMNYNRDKLTLTVLFPFDKQAKAKETTVNISLINRGAGDAMADFIKRIPRVVVLNNQMNQRFESGGWAVNVLSSTKEGSSISKQVGMQKYLFNTTDPNVTLLRVKVELERLDGKGINQGFLVKAQVKDAAGAVYNWVGAGTDFGTYFESRPGGNRSAMVPVQPKAVVEYVFTVPHDAELTEFVWQDLVTVGIHQ